MIENEADAIDFIRQLSGQQAIDRLRQLHEMLAEENARQNLVSATSLAHVWVRHFADSAQLLLHVKHVANDKPWLDLGSGAGFPGVVLAILRPEQEIVLVESRRRRTEWLARACSNLDLKKCRVEGKALEAVDTFAASVIMARAFAPLGKLLDLASRFSESDTVWILPKGRMALEEVSKLPNSRFKMFHVEQSVTSPDAKLLIAKGKFR